jgi:hypothetical protein
MAWHEILQGSFNRAEHPNIAIIVRELGLEIREGLSHLPFL